MSDVIYKYPIANGRQVIWLPEGAKVLTVQAQNNEPQMWAIVDPDRPAEPRTFIVFPTGLELRDAPGEQLNYIGTFQLERGALVFHLFEIVQSGLAADEEMQRLGEQVAPRLPGLEL